MLRVSAAVVLLLTAIPNLRAAETTIDLLKTIKKVSPEGAGSPAARSAWDKLVAKGPAALPHILAAMDTKDTVVANWLRTAFDRIVSTEMQKGGKRINVKVLLAFVKNPKHEGRARRLALELLEKMQPGTEAKLVTGWLNDPEFRYEAVADLIKRGDQVAKDGDKKKSLTIYQDAFDAVRDVPQAQDLARRLKELGRPVNLAKHFGFLTDWYAAGPFEAKGMTGFKKVYPPEQKVDLKAEMEGRNGKVAWKRYQITEAYAGRPARAVLANLLIPLEVHHDAVAYAFTQFTVPRAMEVEFRGAADDNFTVWVNGKNEFGFEEYRNGVRFDRHRFRVKLKAGTNNVLVKICQAPIDPANPQPNWEFLLRMVDQEGNGVRFKSALPR